MKILFVFIAVSIILLIALAVSLWQNSARKKEKEELEIQNILLLSESNKSFRLLKHEFINQNFTVDMLLQKGDISLARNALSSFQNKLESDAYKNYCTNYILNSLLIYESEKCNQNGIKLNCKAVLSNDVKLDENEMCLLFSSVFDTAVHSLQSRKGSKTINFACKKVSESVIFVSFDLPSKIKCDKSVKNIVKKYSGKIDYAKNGDRYFVKIFV